MSNADRFAKKLSGKLAEVVGNDRTTRARLRNRGWDDYVDGGYPAVNDPAVIACQALIHVGLDNNGYWQDERQLLAAILAFLDEIGRGEPMRGVEELARILMSGPVDTASVEQWFRDAYP